MILINNNIIISVNIAEVYHNCIKNINIGDATLRNNEIIKVCNWLPHISSIDVSTNEMIIRFKDEKEDINLGFTGYEWIFDDYINTFTKKEDVNNGICD